MSLSFPSKGEVLLNLGGVPIFFHSLVHREAAVGWDPLFPAYFSHPRPVPFLLLPVAHSHETKVSSTPVFPGHIKESITVWCTIVLLLLRHLPLSPESCWKLSFCTHEVYSTRGPGCPLPPGSQKCPLLLGINPPAKILPSCHRLFLFSFF